MTSDNIHYDQIAWILKMQGWFKVRKAIHRINNCISKRHGEKEMKNTKWF